MNFNFSYVLQQPFRLLWKHKRLALLNLPGSLAGAGFMALFPLIFILPFFAETEAFSRLFDDPWPIFALAFGGPFVLFLIMTPISIFTSTALIKGIATLEKGQDPGGLGDMLREAKPSFWRVAGLTGLQTLAGFLVAALPGILILITVGVALICLGPLMPLLTPLSFVLGLVGILAMHILIIEDVGVIEAIKMAWQVFKKTWLNLLLVFLIVFQGAGIVLGLVFVVPALAIIPFFIAFASSDPQNAALPIGIGVVALLLFIPFFVIGMMAFGTYTQTAMALTYLEVRKYGTHLTSYPLTPPL